MCLNGAYAQMSQYRIVKLAQPAPGTVPQPTVVKRGTFTQVQDWVCGQGLRFVRDQSLFGGYWVDDHDDGAGYQIDIETSNERR